MTDQVTREEYIPPTFSDMRGKYMNVLDVVNTFMQVQTEEEVNALMSSEGRRRELHLALCDLSGLGTTAHPWELCRYKAFLKWISMIIDRFVEDPKHSEYDMRFIDYFVDVEYVGHAYPKLSDRWLSVLRDHLHYMTIRGLSVHEMLCRAIKKRCHLRFAAGRFVEDSMLASLLAESLGVEFRGDFPATVDPIQ